MADNFFLVGNGSLLYRRAGSLVRTPILKTITLTPDERAWYAVAGSYSNGWPTAGFINNGHYLEITHTGKRMRRAFLTPGINQMWRKVTTAHDPEFVFYQGAFSTTHGIRDATYEAYMQLCGYHFTIPSQYAGFGVESVRLKMLHGGTILQYDLGGGIDFPPYFATQSPDWLYATGWKNNWAQKFGVFKSLDDPTAMFAHATDTVTLDTTRVSGTPEGWRDLWGIGTSENPRRGYIPTATSVYTQSIDLSSSCVNEINTSRGGWIVGIPDVSVSTNEDEDYIATDYPFYSPGGAQTSFGYWLCYSHWGFTLEVQLSI